LVTAIFTKYCTKNKRKKIQNSNLVTRDEVFGGGNIYKILYKRKKKLENINSGLFTKE